MPKYVCKRCNKKYEAMTPEGFCNNQPDCEYGSGWLSEVKDGDTGAEASSAAPAIRFDNEAGLCVLMMDGSLSMGDLAFPKTHYPGTKYRLVSTNTAGAIHPPGSADPALRTRNPAALRERRTTRLRVGVGGSGPVQRRSDHPHPMGRHLARGLTVSRRYALSSPVSVLPGTPEGLNVQE